MVESASFEENILKIFKQEYNDTIAEKAISGYKSYLKQYQSKDSFDFGIIASDISGKDNDPTQSTLYSILLNELQSNSDAFKNKDDQNKLYSLILSIVNGLLISC